MTLARSTFSAALTALSGLGFASLTAASPEQLRVDLLVDLPPVNAFSSHTAFRFEIAANGDVVATAFTSPSARGIRILVASGDANPDLTLGTDGFFQGGSQISCRDVESDTSVSCEYFGRHLDASGDLIVAGSNVGNGSRTDTPVYVLKRDPVASPYYHYTYSLLERLSNDSGAAVRFGASVAVDGDTIAVGAPERAAGGSGRVFLYRRGSESGPFALDQELTGPPGAYFGSDVALHGDRLVVASDNRDYFRGGPPPVAPEVFVRTASGWVSEGQLVPSTTGATSGSLYPSVAIQGDVIVVGSSSVDEGGLAARGAAWVFERDAQGWQRTQTLEPGIQASLHRFGSDVDIHGDSIVIGAPSPAPATPQQPAVYLFQRQGASFVRVRTIDGGGGSFPVHVGLGSWVAVTEEAIYASAARKIVVSAEGYAPEAISRIVRPELFPDDAEAAGLLRSSAAFHYLDDLYDTDARGPVFELADPSSIYTAADHARSLEAEALVVAALEHHQDDPGLRGLLLDLYYHRTEAARILAGIGLAEIEEVQLGLTTSSACTQPPVIDREICVLESTVQKLEWALAGGIDASTSAAGGGYFDLLTTGLDVAYVRPNFPPRYCQFLPTSALCLQVGHLIFSDEVPGRDLFPAAGALPAGDDAPLFTGHKDAVLLLGVLRDLGAVSTRLATLLAMRGDTEAAADTIAHRQAQLLAQGRVLLGVLPDLESEADPSSGAAQAVAAWRQAIGDLTRVAVDVRSGANPLGYDEDFLIFMPQTAASGPSFDSYDRLAQYVMADDLKPLRAATVALLGAAGVDGVRQTYAAYRDGQDELALELAALETHYGDRIADIVGLSREDPNFLLAQEQPLVYGASGEVAQQLLSIEAARLTIERNRREMDNLRAKIGIEVARSSQVVQIVRAGGTQQATLTEAIGEIESAQAGAESVAEVFTAGITNPFALIAGIFGAGANAAIQAVTEQKKAELEASKERAAALENAQIEGVESGARIQTWLLDMALLAIDSQSAALLLRQELARLEALVDEKSRLEAALETSSASLARRYFADPIHRLRAEGDVRGAQVRFERAQRWLFYLARALEYKWNQDFAQVGFTVESVFTARNAEELLDLYGAMEVFDQDRSLTNVFEFPAEVSLRRDILGYVEGTDENGDPLLYPDPDPTSDALLTADEAWRRWVTSLPRSGREAVIGFSTARPFSALGILDPSTTLDKISGMRVVLPGAGAGFTFSTLEYGGTSLMRPVSAQEEGFRTFSTRSWASNLTGQGPPLVVDDGVFAFVQVLRGAAPALDCDSPGGTGWIDTFNERSVASSRWELEIDANVLAQADDVELHLCHRFIGRQ